jgi:hypothetical protein
VEFCSTYSECSTGTVTNLIPTNLIERNICDGIVRRIITVLDEVVVISRIIKVEVSVRDEPKTGLIV